MPTTEPSAALAAKLGVKPEARAYLGAAPEALARVVSAAASRCSTALVGSFGFMLAFVESAARLDARFPQLSRHLAAGGALWIAWRKGGRGGKDTDLSLHEVIAIGYRHGLVESKTIALDATWSAIKFTRPRPGKQYANSYGRLAG